MTILAGDVKLMASQVMDDADNGGGAPSSTVIVDGGSNGVFNDISEVDRAGGRVNMRKLFAAVQTDTTDGYFGGNLIVAEPPQDPLVSVTLFGTGDVFDRRADAKSRLEAYLALGPSFAGYLYGNHIAGQMVVTLLQREDADVPVVGDTLVLVKKPGANDEFQQFVRVTDVSSVVRTFSEDANGQQVDFKRRQVSLDISDQLLVDFPGFDAMRLDASINYTGKTKIHSTVVADAARYYGTSPLDVAATTGSYSVQAESMFSQLVPSTRIEVPIADARLNQQSAMLTPAGGALSQTLTAAFSSTQSLYVGGSILPGSLSVVRNGVTITDKGGLLIDSTGASIGSVDYENGVLALTSSIFGTGAGSNVVNYVPAGLPSVVTNTIGLAVTQQGQRLSWVVTLDPVPSKASLQVSFRAQGRWYVLRDDGSGAIRGSDAAFGAGSVNYTSGTVSLTLGAMPDVDSRIILGWASSEDSRPVSSVPAASPALPQAFGRLIQLPGAIKPGTLTITWNDGVARTSTDNNSELAGDASGVVEYSQGRISFRPNLLPPKNTTIEIAITEATQVTNTVSTFSDGGSVWSFNVGAGVKPRSVSLSVVGRYANRVYPGVDENLTISVLVFDDGNGNLQVANVTGNSNVGTINYSSGACSLNKTLTGYKTDQATFKNTTPLNAAGDTSSYIKRGANEIRNVTLTFLNGPGATVMVQPPWAWWTGGQANAAQYRVASTDGTSQTYNVTLDSIFMPIAPEYSPLRTLMIYAQVSAVYRDASFTLGGQQYAERATLIVNNISPATGLGTTVGAMVYEAGRHGARLTDWPAGVSSAPTNVRGVEQQPVAGSATQMLTDSAVVRSAVSPLLNGGFAVSGTRRTGASFTASADNAGLINTGGAPANADAFGTFGVFGRVDYEMGIADLRFGQVAGANKHADTGVIDISALGIPGVTHILAEGVQSDTLRYNAVGYAYLPLDSEILGINPVRLPADGRVPIFRNGTFVVVGHTGEITATVNNGQTINCARTRLSRVRVVGNNGAVISTGYTADLDAGTVTFTNVTGYSQPVTVQHRIEDMMLLRDAQINGQLTFTRPLTHDFPLGSYVSSALIAGDLRARVSVLFDQASFNNVWQDTIGSGSAATGTYNDILHPIELTNRGTLTERWAIHFTNNTSFNVIGEHVGVVAAGNINSDLAPLNPATGTPYFTLRSAGWGLGWSAGNVLRFNTVGAYFPAWLVRTILQGPETVTDDSFTLLVRGDVDRP